MIQYAGEYGILPHEMYNMTPSELSNLIVGKVKAIDSERKYQASQLFSNRYVSNSKNPKFSDIYTSFFEHDAVVSTNERDQITEMWEVFYNKNKQSRDN